MATADPQEADLPTRTLVLCFDGTGNLYDAMNTNVVKLFSMLAKDRREEQLVYYQAGVGTYISTPGMWAGFKLWLAKLSDEAIAWYLDAHVTGGYEFLMQNWREGDRICLYGFSRGAYTARALAGMLYKVGLLPKDNLEQIGFAYKMYTATGAANDKLAAGFKQAFCREVVIDFMGCWDTVSSVGLFWGRHLPFASGTANIRHFRHALSLDEHRAKFQPNCWHRDAPNDAGAVLDPERASNPVGGNGSRRKDPKDPPTDVLEIWFAGCHSDVGGGETVNEAPRTLSDVSLRWMVRETIEAKCGVLFEAASLSALGLSPDGSDLGSGTGTGSGSESGTGSSGAAGEGGKTMDAADAVEPLHDELLLRPLWWVLEVLPTFQSWQDGNGVWHRAFRWNLARGRTIQLVDAKPPRLHWTVRTRMQDGPLKYVPRAMWPGKPQAEFSDE